MDQQVSELAFPRYTRTGYINQGRHSDKLLETFLENIPGQGYLPPRWKFTDYEQFEADYGHLGTILWSASYSSHLLVVDGCKAVRIWTDTSRHCWVDAVPNVLANPVAIPASNSRKSSPFVFREKIIVIADIFTLAKRVQKVYGI